MKTDINYLQRLHNELVNSCSLYRECMWSETEVLPSEYFAPHYQSEDKQVILQLRILKTAHIPGQNVTSKSLAK